MHMSPFGTCVRCGEAEGRWSGENEARCATPGCDLPLSRVEQRIVVEIAGKPVAVAPDGVREVAPQPYE